MFFKITELLLTFYLYSMRKNNKYRNILPVPKKNLIVKIYFCRFYRDKNGTSCHHRYGN